MECYDAGDTTSGLNTINSWVQRVREVFDLMPTQGEEAAANIATRMAAVPRAYRQLSATLLDAARDGRSADRRQVDEVAGQCAAWARPGDSFYPGLAGRLTAVPDSLRKELAVAGRAAAAAAELGVFLRRERIEAAIAPTTDGGSTTPGPPVTGPGPAGCGGWYRTASRLSPPGRRTLSSTTRAFPVITCRYRTLWRRRKA